MEPIKLYDAQTSWGVIKNRVASPEKKNYEFLHWSLTKGGTSIPNDHVFREDTTLFAVFEKISILLTLYFNTDGGFQINPYQVQYGDTFGKIKVFLVNPYKENYTFKHWSLTKNGTAISDDYVFEHSTTLFAVYKLNENVITIKLDTQGAGELTTINVIPSYWRDFKNIVETPKLEGKVFKHWSLTKGGEAITDSYKFTKNTTIFAVYK